MMLRRRRRRGTALVESAMVYPVLFLLVLGIVILGISVFRYQQVAHIAREASRWAAVHGARYSRETGMPTTTPQSVYTNVIVPQAAGMGLDGITHSVVWTTNQEQTHSMVVIDPATGNDKVVTVANTVSVTVTYSWNTGLFGTVPVSSTSVMVMSF
jgi:Flp pilus assembly protein TadG